MGQGASSLNPENYPQVWLMRKDGCNAYLSLSTTSFPFHERPAEISDNTLWDRFGNDMNQHLPMINKGMKLFFYCYFILVFSFVVGMQAIVKTEYAGDTFYFAIAMAPIILGYVFCYLRVINKNQKLDEDINSVCVQYDAEFQRIGYSPVYKTLYTGFCKPKWAVPTRTIVFRPIDQDKFNFNRKTTNNII